MVKNSAMDFFFKFYVTIQSHCYPVLKISTGRVGLARLYLAGISEEACVIGKLFQWHCFSPLLLCQNANPNTGFYSCFFSLGDLLNYNLIRFHWFRKKKGLMFFGRNHTKMATVIYWGDPTLLQSLLFGPLWKMLNWNRKQKRA